ncbi:MAG TPA: hypothetical protein VL961_09695 [Acidimicrobiales bacterium]|nr:hypothetical protein [Acidimicrobiales bacterium]
MADQRFTDSITNRALDTVDLVVGTVHDKLVRPAVVGARGVVFGIIIAVVAILIAVLVSIGFIRLMTVYAFDHKVWISYLVLGAIFCGAGAFAYTKRVASGHD